MEQDKTPSNAAEGRLNAIVSCWDGNAILMKIVSDLIMRGIEIKLSFYDGHLRANFINGFYKSDGDVYLVTIDGGVELHTRYGEIDDVIDWQDVVNESLGWYDASKNRHDGWATPPHEWVNLYEIVGS